MSDIPYHLRACISEMKVRTKYRKDKKGDMVFDGYTTEVKLESKLSALKELRSILMPPVQMAQQGPVNITNNVVANLDKEKTDKVIEILSGQQKDEKILELEKIEECHLEQ